MTVQKILTSHLVAAVSAVEVTFPDGTTAVCEVVSLEGKRGCKGNTVATLRDLQTGGTFRVGWNPETRDAAGHAIPVPAGLRVLTLAQIMDFAGKQAIVTASVEVSTETVDAPLTAAVLADMEQATTTDAVLESGEILVDA